jgi:hypothetical protein
MKKIKYQYDPKYHDIKDSCYTKESKLWEEVEALFWSLAFKEEIERGLSFGCYQTHRRPGCQ